MLHLLVIIGIWEKNFFRFYSKDVIWFASVLTFSGIAAPVPGQPQFIVPAHSPQFMQGSGPDQTAGWGGE